MGCGAERSVLLVRGRRDHPGHRDPVESIGGYGLPMALTLFKPELDLWAPGEHNGTFRGNNPAFVTATAALDHYWADDALQKSTLAKGERDQPDLLDLAQTFDGVSTRGPRHGPGSGVRRSRYGRQGVRNRIRRGVLAETSGPSDEVVKLLPPLTITEAEPTTD
ncbi:hypothetical protein GS831_22790 [Rhodococcus hoagii]|nr:hypothetical protein [Prescottella equi]